jgi:DNA primase
LGRIPQSALSEIRNRVDIVDLVGRYVTLKKAGRNHKGLCPFHDEKTPSFNVSAERQIFKCFGCDAGGGAIDFLMRHENLSFPEAARTLAHDCGVEIPEESAADAESRGISERVHEANEIAQRLYVDALASAAGEEARAYLDRRGLDSATRREVGVGFAPDRWDSVQRALRDAKIDGELGKKAGLLSERKGGDGHYDLLRGRITFPIYDVRRRIVGFGGRALGAEQEPKYLNTPESPVYRKRESFYGFPWALEAIRKRERAIICEGYFDRIALHRAGLAEGLATCGTALTREHGRQLRRRTQVAILLFDGDSAGQKAMERALEVLLPEGLRVRAATLPRGQDPDDYLVAEGPDALVALVDAAPDALEITIRAAVARGVASPADKADAVGHVAPLVALVSNPIEREAWVRRLALATDSSETGVSAIVRASATGKSRPEVDLVEARPRKKGPEDRNLSLLCQVLLRHPALATIENRARVERSLPDGSDGDGAAPWKRVALALLDASERGWVDAEGGIDHFQVAEELGVDARGLLHEAAAAEEPVDPDAGPELVLSQVLDWFERRGGASERGAATNLLRAAVEHDPEGGDTAALLAEKQRQLEERRARLRASAAGTAQGTTR